MTRENDRAEFIRKAKKQLQSMTEFGRMAVDRIVVGDSEPEELWQAGNLGIQLRRHELTSWEILDEEAPEAGAEPNQWPVPPEPDPADEEPEEYEDVPEEDPAEPDAVPESAAVEDVPEDPTGLTVPEPVQLAEEPSRSPDDWFEIFWEQYPTGRKFNKKRSKEKFLRAVKKDGVDPRTIIDGAIEYGASELGRSEFVCTPVVFLNQARWEDDRASWRVLDSTKPDRELRGSIHRAEEFIREGELERATIDAPAAKRITREDG